MNLSQEPSEILKVAFEKALSIADPRQSLPRALESIFTNPVQGRCIVVGAGKAGASMAAAFEEFSKTHWPNAQIEGLVITRYGHDIEDPPLNRAIKILEAAHPVPDQAGFHAAQQMRDLILTIKPGDHLIALISGGGSSLLSLPAGKITMEDLRDLTKILLRSGAPIEEMNVVRKHLSALQGGHLAKLAVERGAQVDAFIISDVTGDRAEDIASGPCAADSSTYEDALGILQKYDLLRGDTEIAPSIIEHLTLGVQGQISETLKPHDPHLPHIRNHVFATAYASLEAAAQYCQSLGIDTLILGDSLTGEACDVAKEQAKLTKAIIEGAHVQKLPVAIISGGECTVTIPKGIHGRGGRCSEFLLSYFKETQHLEHVSALAADTDGIDGSENNAGAWFTPEIREYSKTQSLDAQSFLDQHDAFGFFEKTNSLLFTGPTLTNVNDFRILLIQSK